MKHSKFLILSVVLVFHLQKISAHGRLMDPINRSSMWRRGYKTPINYNDNENFCGGFFELIAEVKKLKQETNKERWKLELRLTNAERYINKLKNEERERRERNWEREEWLAERNERGDKEKQQRQWRR
ncbi:uncharacterized protein LOC122510907 [Leptopilina heterotoma]|uniref:uncharacterized protein LOC122510907 n=1 Tax=Leptopilina heterotoma TaxID=63436 RepID=UPI001CA8CF54|nr:uncharacterized protein LOC122510907 [Leptopilina heterotoma]